LESAFYRHDGYYGYDGCYGYDILQIAKKMKLEMVENWVRTT